MAIYAPISGIATQFEDYAEYWLKFYVPSTSTPMPMYTDITGATALAKARLDVNGFITTDGETIFIPFIGFTYDAYLFPTEEDADANNTVDAIRVADNINPLASASLLDVGVVYTFGHLQGSGEDDTAALNQLLSDNPRKIIRLHTDITLGSALIQGLLDNITLDLNGYSIHVDHEGRLIASATADPVDNLIMYNGRVYSNENASSEYIAGNSVFSISNSHIDNVTFDGWGEDALNLVDGNSIGTVYIDEIRDNAIVFRGSNNSVLSVIGGVIAGDAILYKGIKNTVQSASFTSVGFRPDASNDKADFSAGSGAVFGADGDSCSDCFLGYIFVKTCGAYVVTFDPASDRCRVETAMAETCYFDDYYPKAGADANPYAALIQGRENSIGSIHVDNYPWGLAFGGTRNYKQSVGSFTADTISFSTALNIEGTDLTDIRIGDFIINSCKSNGAVRIFSDSVKVENFQILDCTSGGATPAVQIAGDNIEFDQFVCIGHHFPSAPATWTLNTNYVRNTGLVLSAVNYWVLKNHKAGIWIARTEYLAGDYVYDTVTASNYICLVDNTANKTQSTGFAIDLALGYWQLDAGATNQDLLDTDIRLGNIRLEGSRNATGNGVRITGSNSRFGYLKTSLFDGYNLVLEAAADIDKFHLEGSPDSYDDVLRVQSGITQILSGGVVVPSNGYHTEAREGSTLVFTNNNAMDAIQDAAAGDAPALSRVINANNTQGYLPKQKVEVIGGATALTLSTTLAAINLQATGFTNTVNIMGASLSTTDITLPAGRYELYIEALFSKSDGSAGQLAVSGQVSVTSGDTKVISLPACRSGLVASGASVANISAVRELTLNQTSVVQIQFDGSANTAIEGTIAESKNFYLKITEA